MKRILFLLAALVACFCIAGSGGRVAHASTDLGVCQTYQTDQDNVLFVSFDCHTFWAVTGGSNGVYNVGVGSSIAAKSFTVISCTGISHLRLKGTDESSRQTARQA